MFTISQRFVIYLYAGGWAVLVAIRLRHNIERGNILTIVYEVTILILFAVLAAFPDAVLAVLKKCRCWFQSHTKF